jgi:type II secretory pathway pseudopilin PulG
MFLLILFLGYVLFTQIKEPISFQQEKQKREQAVVQQLIQIRKAQEAYRGVTGNFANSFEELKTGLENGKFRLIQVYGDPDDPNNKEAIRYDTTYTQAIDSVKAMGIVLDGLGKVPFGEGAEFEIFADTASYQSSTVEVVEVGVEYEKFMGKFADRKFRKYDERYDPKKRIKFGDKSKPILTGSWE